MLHEAGTEADRLAAGETPIGILAHAVGARANPRPSHCPELLADLHRHLVREVDAWP
ncbi:hypothetical protein PA01_00055 [Azoarcus sp. PA01]|nr:hypothetical protein PA01_19290 [Azoarcus sp. PA01]KON82491.2 hypothetical protein PA01_00055 [Azoarcus sp. PA01]